MPVCVCVCVCVNTGKENNWNLSNKQPFLTTRTVGAPSISSMIRQFGLLESVSTACIWVADWRMLRNTSGLRSSLQVKTIKSTSFCYILLVKALLTHIQSLRSLSFSLYLSLSLSVFLSDLAFISTTEYPACVAMMWASVVLPNPGDPHNSATWERQFRQPYTSQSNIHFKKGLHIKLPICKWNREQQKCFILHSKRIESITFERQ